MIIGITTKALRSPEDEPGSLGTWTACVDSIAAAGGVPLLLPLTEDLALLRRMYEAVDGLLIPGGEDVDPKHYGAAPDPRLGRTSSMRDAAEIQLARWAHEDEKPLLAICRGMQILNVALGGTLHQHIDGHETEGLDGWTELVHDLVLTNDARLAGLLGTARIAVNSLHHQAIAKLALALRITGHAPDGVIEAVESASAIGVQCHPETLWQEREPRWLALFQDLVTRCRRP